MGEARWGVAGAVGRQQNMGALRGQVGQQGCKEVAAAGIYEI